MMKNKLLLFLFVAMSFVKIQVMDRKRKFESISKDDSNNGLSLMEQLQQADDCLLTAREKKLRAFIGFVPYSVYLPGELTAEQKLIIDRLGLEVIEAQDKVYQSKKLIYLHEKFRLQQRWTEIFPGAKKLSDEFVIKNLATMWNYQQFESLDSDIVQQAKYFQAATEGGQIVENELRVQKRKNEEADRAYSKSRWWG